jgi:uncharacterized delta-60 repeat protein
MPMLLLIRMAMFALRSHFRALVKLICALLASTFPAPAIAQTTGCAGTVDPSFVAAYFNETPQKIITDGDRTIAAFDKVIVRLNEDGALDSTFIASLEGPPFDNTVLALVKDSTGAFLFGGYLEKVNDNARPGLARLLPNGDLDTSFPQMNEFFKKWTRVTALATQPDGKILVAGLSYLAGRLPYFVHRLNADGSLDLTFNPVIADKEILALAVEADGSILAGGLFTSIAGHPRNQLCRLQSNGALDETFDPARHIFDVGELNVLPDGKFLARTSPVGWVDSTNIPGTNGLARLNKNGSLDLAFPVGTYIHDMAVQRDGRCLVGFEYDHVKRFLPNGAEDPTFDADTPATAVALDSRERIIIAGTQYINRLYRKSVARLLNDADPCIPLFSVETNGYTFIEANTILSIPIVRSGDVSSPSSVGVWLSGDLRGETLLEDTVTFAAGVTRAEARIAMKDNRTLENARTLGFHLSATASGSALGTAWQATIEVLDASSHNAPGSLDISFNVETPYTYSPLTVLATPNNKIITRVETSIQRLVRFNPDSSEDDAFNYSLNAGPGAFAAWEDKLYVCIAPFDDASNNLFRLLSDGSTDPTFTPPLFKTRYHGNALVALHVHADGKSLVAGYFTNVNDTPLTNFARINADGSLDTSLNTGDIFSRDGSQIFAVHGLADGSYLIGGDFYAYDFDHARPLTHITASGSLINDFFLPPGVTAITCIAGLPDGSVLVGATLSGGNPPSRVLRFSKEGLFNQSFQAAARPGPIHQIIPQVDGKILIVAFGPQPLQRLNSDGSLDPSFYTPLFPFDYVRAALDNAGNLYARTVSRLMRLRAGPYAGSGVFEIAGPQLVYEDEGTAKIKVRRGWSTQGEATVRLKTTDGSAHAGEHYISVDTPVVFADGELEKIVDIPLINNPALALSEVSFNLTLNADAPASTTQTGATNSVTIREAKTGFILLSEPAFISEKPAYPVRVYVRRIGPPNGPASVDVVTDGGTASIGVDYQPAIQRVYFTGGPSNWMEAQSVIITPIDDAVTEEPETIRIFLRDPSPGMSLLDPSTNLFILRDDAEEFRFTQQSITAIQNDNNVTFVVQPIVPSGISRQWTTVHLNYTTEGGTAIPGVEFTPQQGVLTFEPGDPKAKQITIPLLPNSIVGDPTTINLTLTPVEPEILLTNRVAQAILLHPTSVLPAGTHDPRFPQLSNYLITTTSNFVYVLGPVAQSDTTIARFRHDGTFDQSFRTVWTNGVYWLRDLPDGGILLSSYPYTLLRLTPSGAIDPSFKPKLPNLSHFGDAAITPDGKIFLQGYLDITPFTFITQLLPDGSVDPAFDTLYFPDYDNHVGAVELQPDGKVIITGSFTQIRGVPRNGIARLLPNGELDPSFEVQSPVGALRWLPDGRFYSIEYNPTTPSRQSFIRSIVRYNADGTLDNTFNYPSTQTASDYEIPQTDAKGRIYFYDGKTITRTLPDGSPDADFKTPATGTGIETTDHGLLLISAFYYGAPLITRLFMDSPPAAMRPPVTLPNGHVEYSFNFPVGTTYILEATTDFLTWTEISSGTSQEDIVRIEQSSPPAEAVFYRLRSK